MDAAYKLSKNTTLLSMLALVAIAPWHAQAQSFSTTTTSLSVGSGAVQSLSITGTLDPGTPITFSAAIAYSNGDQPWLQLSGQGSAGCSGLLGPYTTPVTVYFQPGCYASASSTFQSASHTATVTLTETLPSAGASTEVITVTFVPGASGTGTLIPSVNSVTLSAAPGGLSSYASFNLNTSSSAPITYSIAAPSVSWLSIVSGQTGSASVGSSATVYLQASAINLNSSPPSTNLQVLYNGTSFYIPVSFNVGTGTVNGTLTFANSTFTFGYNTGGATPGAQSTTIGNTTASNYTFVVNATPAGWLLVNNQLPTNGSSYGSWSISNGVFLQPANTTLTTGSYSAIVTITDSNGNTGNLTANLTVNGGSTSTFTIYPNPITVSAPIGANTALVPVSVSSSVAGTLSASVTSSSSGALMIYSGGSQTVTAGTAVTVTIEANSSGLQAGTYTGSLVLAVNGSASQSYPISFTVGGGTSGGTTPSSSTVAPTALNFYYEIGQSIPQAYLEQFITINGPSNFAIGSVTVDNTTVAWLSVGSVSGSSPAQVTVYANPAAGSGLAAGTYTGSFIVSFANGTAPAQTVNVTLTITSASPLLIFNPAVVNVSCTSCTSVQPTFVQVLATDGSTQPISVAASSTGNWLTASIPSTYPSNTPTSIQIGFNNAASLANGLYTGTVGVTSGALSETIAVVLLVSGSTASSGTLSLSPSSMTFNAVVNGTAPVAQTLTVSASSTTSFNVSGTTTNGGNWLSLSPSGSLSTPASVSVSVNQSGLVTGTYNGTISLTSNSVTQTVPVTMLVTNTGSSGGNVTVSPSSLTNFTFVSGGTLPSAQTLTVSSASGSAGIPFTAGASSETNSGNWLLVSPTSGNTPGNVSVSLSATVVASLPAGTYTGDVIITPTSGTVITLPVSLIVQSAPTVSATPATLSFAYQSGGSQPSTVTISVAGTTSGLGFSASASTVNGGSWLSVSPATGTTPASITASVSSSVLSGLAAGTYTGTVMVTGSGTAVGSTTINVTLTVTAPLPTITGVVSAASSAAATAVSPGEIVSIYGTALGPTSPATLMLDSTGKVSTSIGNVTVSFNGFLAPLTYVSATQINCIVPYEIAGSLAPYAQVKYLGQTSNAWSLQPAVSVPALFTANNSGTGPGAILNQDGSFNSQTAAPKGSAIVVYMTGEGQTTPSGVDGKVTTVNSSGIGPLTPKPLLPVSALINNQPALVVFAGEAPGLVSGVLQVNIQLPANAPTGNLPISVSVGSNISQPGVTVAVQ